MARETLMPPPPGSRRSTPQRNLWLGKTCGTDAATSIAGFTVSVTMEVMNGGPGEALPEPCCLHTRVASQISHATARALSRRRHGRRELLLAVGAPAAAPEQRAARSVPPIHVDLD